MFEWMANSSVLPQEPQDSFALDSSPKNALIDNWLSDDEMSTDTSQTWADTIDSYLDLTLVSKETLQREDILGYWKINSRKRHPESLGLRSDYSAHLHLRLTQNEPFPAGVLRLPIFNAQ
ncbi:hypothetical protein BDV93DRAFT_479020 [Ceratobasidium sp. AG-I]|nr:hypothetical protein BDV93DRAFT_479020 [Ceratobasidium sp. AG-I]